MHVITRQEGVLNIIAKTFKKQQWESMYFTGEGWIIKTDEAVYNKLVALGATPNRKQIDDIIGNHSWTDYLCDECHKDADALVALRGGKKVIKVCRNCLNSALKLLNKETK